MPKRGLGLIEHAGHVMVWGKGAVAGDFVFLCVVCGAGSVVYLVSLALFTGMTFRRLGEMWPREDAS